MRSSRNLRMKQRPSVVFRWWATISLNKIQHGWWPPSWKCLWRHSSAAGDPISMKFGVLMENHMPMVVKRSKLKPKKSNNVSRGFKYLVEIWYANSFWPSEMRDVAKSKSVCRFTTLLPPSWKINIWRHNCVATHLIWIKFGKSVRNHMPMTGKWSMSKPEVEFQRGNRLFSSNSSAVDWDTWSKFGTLIALPC